MARRISGRRLVWLSTRSRTKTAFDSSRPAVAGQDQPARSLPTRGLSAILATLLFWSPLHATLVRAQSNESTEPSTHRYSTHEGVRAAVREGESLEEQPVVSHLRTGVDRLDPEKVREAAKQIAERATPTPPPKAGAPSDEEPTAQTPESVVPFSLPTGPSKTAVTPQQIALPKGEGSIEGMGESFTPNLSAGTGTFSVPIALPKGRAGVQPSLALSYSTSAGNGAVGIGWSLAAPFISRQTDKGLPGYRDSAAWSAQEDRFMYNGGQELVPIDSAAAAAREGAPVPSELSGWQQYRARVEGVFMRFFRAPDASRWVVQSKDGSRFEFGACTGPQPCGVNGAARSDPEDRARVFAWHLVRMSDVHGSTVLYEYVENGGTLYLSSIYYTSPARCANPLAPVGARACASDKNEYAHRVRLVYEPRQDVTSSYVTTWRTEQTLRLKRIEAVSAGDVAGIRYLVRRYHLTYDTESFHSLLTKVQVEGRPSRFDQSLGVTVFEAPVSEASLNDKLVGDLLPPMRFSYSKPTTTSGSIRGFGGIDSTVHASGNSPDHSADEGRADLFDVNSDGLPDLLVTDPARYAGGAGVYFNGLSEEGPTQPGTFSRGIRVGVPGGLSGVFNLSNLNVLPMDIDGDGRSDMLHMPRAANYGYFVLSKEPAAPGSSYLPTAGWSFHHVSNLLPQGVTDPRIDLGKDGASIKTLDVNNDHLIDVVRTAGGDVQTWLNLGRYPGGQGRFGSALFSGNRFALSTEPVSTCLPFAGQNLDFSDPRVRIADMNGDGLQDIVKVAADDVVWWPGRGDGAWGDGPRDCNDRNRGTRALRMEAPPRELNPELSGMHLVDVNGDGPVDLLYVGFSELSVWFNKNGTGFTERLVVDGTPYAAEVMDRVRIADVDGSGTTDILFADSGRWRWIDPMGGLRPRLLQTVDNGLGALTTLEYSSSIADYLRDLNDARSCDPAALECFTWQREPVLPGERVGDCDATVLSKSGTCVHRAGGSPVVSTVVRRVKTTDRLSALGAQETETETEYRYHDGYYEGIEQEFRGFGAADAIAVGDEYEPSSTTRTYFHQGQRPNDIAADRLSDNPNEALKGREYLTEVSDGLGLYLKTSHASYAVRELFTGLNGTTVSYAYVQAANEFLYDTSVTTQREGPTLSLPSVVRERAGNDLSTVLNAPARAGDAPHLVRTRHLPHAPITNTIDVVDNVGNMRQQTARGRDGNGEYQELVAYEGIVSTATPVRVDDRACSDSGWLWRTARSWKADGGSGALYGDTRNEYNECGDLLRVTRDAQLPSTGAFLFPGSGTAPGFTQTAYQEVSTSAVNAWGQATASCAGADLSSDDGNCLRLAKVKYDDAYQALAVEESVAISGSGASTQYLKTRATWDRGLGVLLTTTDPNGLVTEVLYDGVGRLTGMIEPPVSGCEGVRIPTTRVSYNLTQDPVSSPLSQVTTTTITSCLSSFSPESQIVVHAYVDGLSRPRAGLAEAEADVQASLDGQAHDYRWSGRTLLTKKGRARKTYQTAFFNGDPKDLKAVMGLPSVPFTRATYDAFGRPILSVNEDCTYKSLSYHALSQDVCDEVDNGFGAPGTDAFKKSCTTERKDGHGRTIDQHLRQVTAAGVKENHRLFTYYRADGAVTRVVRAQTIDNVLRPDRGYNGLSKWVERRFHYDTLGKRVASEDPDTDDKSQSLNQRTWRYLFNKVGDLVAVRDPRGCGQNFYYDLAGRLLGEAYVGCAEAQVGELATSDVPAGSVAMARTTAATQVHVRNHFDAYPSWVSGRPGGAAPVLGRATANEDRGQRSAIAYDARGNVVWGTRQLAVIPTAVSVTSATDATGRPAFDASGEGSVAAASVTYDAAHSYTRTATFDHAGRSLETNYPMDPDYARSTSDSNTTAPTLMGKLFYYKSGTPRRAELTIDGVSKPIIERVKYARDGAPEATIYGDQAFTGRPATNTTTTFDARRRPIEILTLRTPVANAAAQTLSAVTEVFHQRLSWDGASNLYSIEDRRPASQWPDGHKPYDQQIFHDGLYRVASVFYDYKTNSFEDAATDWRTEEDLHRAADPMRANAADMVAMQAPKRVNQVDYTHDFLANMTSWTDDARVFYERSIGSIANGQDLTPNATGGESTERLRPSALYLSTDLLPLDAAPGQADRGGWLEADYGKGGNLLALTVHGQCSHAAANKCVAPAGTRTLDQRRSDLSSGCVCAREQHYVYRWDELNRLHEARRYDRSNGGAWTIAARQRVRYDGGNQRVVKQTFDTSNGTHRAALYVYPGDFERRGLVPSSDGLSWVPAADGKTETQYEIAGARVIWQNRAHRGSQIDPQQRITFALSNLIQSTSGVVDLVSGELVEVGGFYPNGAREESLSASAELPLEVLGFTGKEADEEIGLTYFGERYLVPRIGRWATPDPLAIHAMGGGEAGNAYHYVSGNLLQARDPIGLEASILDKIIGRAVQAAYKVASVQFRNSLPEQAMDTYLAPGRKPGDGTLRLSRQQVDNLSRTVPELADKIKTEKAQLSAAAADALKSGESRGSSDPSTTTRTPQSWMNDIVQRLKERSAATGEATSESVTTADYAPVVHDRRTSGSFVQSGPESPTAFIVLGGFRTHFEGTVTYTPEAPGTPASVTLNLKPVVTDTFDFHSKTQDSGTGWVDHALNRLQDSGYANSFRIEGAGSGFTLRVEAPSGSSASAPAASGTSPQPSPIASPPANKDNS